MSNLRELVINTGLIPFFKTWMIRMGALDLLNGRRDIITFLEKQKRLSGDMTALKNIAYVWDNPSVPYPVNESATLFRFVKFFTMKYGISREISISGTLIERVAKMELPPDIGSWPLNRLLTLEGGTSQWATMAILMGNDEVLPEVPFYLQETYDAKKHWHERIGRGEAWDPKIDVTLLAQAEEYLYFLKTGKMRTKPNRLGDCDLFCFLRTFNAMKTSKGRLFWPQMRCHESNRLEIGKYLAELYSGGIITSDDHRVVQACAMRIQAKNINQPVELIRQRFVHPECVNKAWPEFWDFLAEIPKLLEQVKI